MKNGTYIPSTSITIRSMASNVDIVVNECRYLPVYAVGLAKLAYFDDLLRSYHSVD